MILLSGEESLCAACLRTPGRLCDRCKPDVLPQLKQPSWHRHAHSGVWTNEKEQKATMSPEARRVYNRKRTKAARRAVSAKARERALASLAA